ncbi:hypothetical protein HII36_54115, partial [Nonomuraea sp. NN258]|uniref:hypothetical protein n=1 Tax=Nonomuraea antri TaxID=2730852 RepID=UPI001567CCD8
MSEWASIRLAGPPHAVAELVRQLGAAGIDVEQPSPVPHPAEVESVWHAVVRPAGWGSPVQRGQRGRGWACPPAPRLVAGIDGPRLMVAGAVVAEAYERARAWAEQRGWTLVDPPEVVEVESIRAVDYCPPHCGCGQVGAHFLPVARRVRG